MIKISYSPDGSGILLWRSRGFGIAIKDIADSGTKGLIKNIISAPKKKLFSLKS
jgi:hypothetical protein